MASEFACDWFNPLVIGSLSRAWLKYNHVEFDWINKGMQILEAGINSSSVNKKKRITKQTEALDIRSLIKINNNNNNE